MKNKVETKDPKVEKKGVLKIHTNPLTISDAHLSMLMSLLTHALELGKELPGVSFPIQVSVTIDGINTCGSVELAKVEKSKKIDGLL